MKHVVLILFGGLLLLALSIYLYGTIKEGFSYDETSVPVRYVRIEVQNLPIHIQELEVYDKKGINVATKSKASQSALTPGAVLKEGWGLWANGFMFGGDPAITIDGNKSDGQAWPNSNHTDGVGMNFLELDLTSDITVNKIVVYNRPDCCQVNLAGAKLTLLDQTRKQVGKTIILNADRMQTFLISPVGFDETSLPVQFVRIDQSNQYLHIRELQVYDTKEENVALKGKASMSSNPDPSNPDWLKFWGPDRVNDNNLGTLNHTNVSPKEWIELDLLSGVVVTKIVVYNRDDTYDFRLAGSKLTLLDKNKRQIGETFVLTADRMQTFVIKSITFDDSNLNALKDNTAGSNNAANERQKALNVYSGNHAAAQTALEARNNATKSNTDAQTALQTSTRDQASAESAYQAAYGDLVNARNNANTRHAEQTGIVTTANGNRATAVQNLANANYYWNQANVDLYNANNTYQAAVNKANDLWGAGHTKWNW